ncbi:ABC transporter permease [Mycoplasmopsis ciconiae]|uniref:ABC transporter permease n=1 Tax=Mycoplasmopsis ciconiae TaxID=561067 RepID=A0ABU7MKE8_9BACT|nr:ABC transporter permease [Mycoplasmopsis ciconiae]
MSKLVKILKHSYIYIILGLMYIPLATGALFSFNDNSKKGGFLTNFDRFTFKHWANLFEDGRDIALVNSVIIAILVSVIVITLSLLTVYSIYKQKTKFIRGFVTGNSNIPLINPDNITAIGLVLFFGALFGVISSDSEGLWRVIIAQTIMALPYGISLMLPRSDKFNWNLFEASQDLGYSPFKSWFKTYFIYMIPSIIMVFIVTSFLSIDDFIITRTVSNTTTLGLKLYEGAFEPWALVLGTILLLFTLVGNAIYVIVKKASVSRNKIVVLDTNVIKKTRKNKNNNLKTNTTKWKKEALE